MKHLHKKNTTNAYMGWIVLVLMAVMLAVIWFILPVKKRGKETTKDKKHRVVITGGSQGIGLALAHEFVRNGTCCHVTLLARTKSKLEEAQKELLKVSNDVIVDFYPVDVTNPKAIQKVAEEICKSSSTTPDMLFNVAGTAISRSFLDADIGDFSHLMNLNYLGSVYTTKAFLPFMLAAHHKRDRINIMFTSSAAGQTGVYGYSAYTPTKFALRGFAECLQMEHARDNVHIQVCFPPDTETPGYTIEQIGKPKETMLISEVAGLYKPEQYVLYTNCFSVHVNHSPFLQFVLNHDFVCIEWRKRWHTVRCCPIHHFLYISVSKVGCWLP